MKSITLNKNTWHYKLATFGEVNRDTSDICAYTKSMLKGLFPFTLLVLLVVLMSASTGDFLAWLLSGIFNGFCEINALSAPAVVVLGLFFFVTVAVSCEQIYKNIPRPNEESVLVHAYRSWKNKYCVKLEFRG